MTQRDPDERQKDYARKRARYWRDAEYRAQRIAANKAWTQENPEKYKAKLRRDAIKRNGDRQSMTWRRRKELTALRAQLDTGTERAA